MTAVQLRRARRKSPYSFLILKELKMAKSRISSSGNRNRTLVCESLEDRRLLACNAIVDHTMLQPNMVSAFVGGATAHANPPDPFTMIVREATARGELPVDSQPEDWGSAALRQSSRGIAHIGAIDGQRSFRGTLGWFNLQQTFHFSLQSDAHVQFGLWPTSRNANLYLVDASGGVIASSTRPGLSNDSMQRLLKAGDYSLIVAATSLLPTSFRVAINARPLALPPSIPPVTTPITSPGNSPTNVQPLPDVPYFGTSRHWNLNVIGAPEAWAAGYSGQGTLVAVLDTGVDLSHPDLISRLYVNPGEIGGNQRDDDGNGLVDDLHGYDFVDRDGTPADGNGHGTHVAGIIKAVAPDATILPVRVLGSSGAGRAADVAAGIRYAADMGARIINLSLGGAYSSIIDAAIDYARSQGSLIVAAAGNESAGVPSFPARFSATDSNVLSVGAFGSSSAIAGFSNSVGNSGAVQVDAPGVSIYSTYVGGGYATLSGTSMAAPHVAGLAALALSSNPSLSAQQLRQLIVSGTMSKASGSDARGSIHATTTVAYAAAGFAGTSVDATAANARWGRESPSGIASTAIHYPIDHGATVRTVRFSLSKPQAETTARINLDVQDDKQNGKFATPLTTPLNRLACRSCLSESSKPHDQFFADFDLKDDERVAAEEVLDSLL
jgi:subtilisin family serine protease